MDRVMHFDDPVFEMSKTVILIGLKLLTKMPANRRDRFKMLAKRLSM